MEDSAEKRIRELERTVEKAQRRRDKASGAIEQLKVQLKEDFQCTSIKQARKKLEKLRARRKELIAMRDKQLEEIEEKHGEAIKATGRTGL